MAIGTKRIEDYLPVVKYNEGLYSELDMTIATGATVTLPSTTTIGGSSVVALGDITSSSTSATAFTVTNSGVYTGTGGVVAIVANSATTPTSIMAITANALTSGGGLVITSTGTMVTTGSLLTLTANSATTAAGILRVNANALTSGIAAVITSSATAITGAGRLLRVDHTGATGTSAILSEFASAATDETVILKVTASAALAAGVAFQVSGASVTTGSLISAADANALTTGSIAAFKSNSSDATARNLVSIHNDHASAVGAVPLQITQDAVISTNFKLLMQFNSGVGIYISDQTTPDGNLTAAEGSICLNGSGTGQAFWNTDGATAWTALA